MTQLSDEQVTDIYHQYFSINKTSMSEEELRIWIQYYEQFLESNWDYKIICTRTCLGLFHALNQIPAIKEQFLHHYGQILTFDNFMAYLDQMKGKRVLLVDDTTINGTFFQAILKQIEPGEVRLGTFQKTAEKKKFFGSKQYDVDCYDQIRSCRLRHYDGEIKRSTNDIWDLIDSLHCPHGEVQTTYVGEKGNYDRLYDKQVWEKIYFQEYSDIVSFMKKENPSHLLASGIRVRFFDVARRVVMLPYVFMKPLFKEELKQIGQLMDDRVIPLYYRFLIEQKQKEIISEFLSQPVSTFNDSILDFGYRELWKTWEKSYDPKTVYTIPSNCTSYSQEAKHFSRYLDPRYGTPNFILGRAFASSTLGHGMLLPFSVSELFSLMKTYTPKASANMIGAITGEALHQGKCASTVMEDGATISHKVYSYSL